MVALITTLVLLHAQTAKTPPLYLLGARQVRREIKLSHRESVKALDMLLLIQSLRPKGGPMVADDKPSRKSPDQVYGELATLLNPAQTERLWQIHRQQNGAAIVYEPAYVERLGMSQAAKNRVLVAIGKAGEEFNATRKKIEPKNRMYLESDRLAARAAYDRYLSKGMSALNAELNASQKQRLKTLMGAPFNFRGLSYDVTMIEGHYPW